jgi:hypothetical protein
MVDRDRLVRYATRRLGQDGEDAVQDAYLRVWEKYRDPALLDHAGTDAESSVPCRREYASDARARQLPPLPLAEWIADPLDVEDRSDHRR